MKSTLAHTGLSLSLFHSLSLSLSLSLFLSLSCLLYTIGLRYLFLPTRQSFARYIGLYREFPNNTDSAIAARNYPRRLIDRPIDDPALSRLADISGVRDCSSSVGYASIEILETRILEMRQLRSPIWQTWLKREFLGLGNGQTKIKCKVVCQGMTSKFWGIFSG